MNGSWHTVRWLFLLLGVVQIATIVLLATGIVGVANTNDRLAGDEHKTCLEQSKGLPASRALRAVIGDLATIVNRPLSPRERAAIKQLPVEIQDAYTDLGNKSQIYFRLQAKTPRSRTC